MLLELVTLVPELLTFRVPTDLRSMVEVVVEEAIWYQLIAVLVLLKYSTRAIFQTSCFGLIPSDSLEFRQRTFFLLEHVLFTIWGYYSVIHYPWKHSWYFQPKLCWVYPPTIPSESFHYFYIAKCATHLEDVAYRLYENYILRAGIPSLPTVASEGASSSAANKGDGESRSTHQPDIMMDIHHYATALLCLLSYASGYFHIGSLLMLIHDASDIPLDLLKIFMLINWDIPTVCYSYFKNANSFSHICSMQLMNTLSHQYVSYVLTLLAWVYFRIYYLSAVLLRSVIVDPTTSFIFPCAGSWQNADCVTGFYAEMSVYVLLIGALWVLHLLWFRKMILKGYRLIKGTDGQSHSQC